MGAEESEMDDEARMIIMRTKKGDDVHTHTHRHPHIYLFSTLLILASQYQIPIILHLNKQPAHHTNLHTHIHKHFLAISHSALHFSRSPLDAAHPHR